MFRSQRRRYTRRVSFTERLVVQTHDVDWSRDPGLGAEVKRLDELTCLVRLAPNEELPFENSRGEEILVLEGDISRETDLFEAGTYLRFPNGPLRVLRSENGGTFFLKRQPFAPSDTERVTTNTRPATWLPGQGRLEVLPLHEHEGRSTALVKWPAGERFVPHQHWGGEEIFVLSGTFLDEHGTYPKGTWLRNPHLSTHHPFVEDETTILVKVGHLA